MTRTRYDIIIIGGGHAGIEAAWAASRMGADVALITMQREYQGLLLWSRESAEHIAPATSCGCGG